jgi:hypothetical protein
MQIGSRVSRSVASVENPGVFPGDQGETLAGALELAPVRANVIALAVHLMANTAVTGDVFR